MKDSSALARQWRLLHSLEARHQGASLQELASEAEVSQRTVQRDLEHFRLVGIPIQ